MKYQRLLGICKTCTGCNRLELKEFKGVYQCINYIKKEFENGKDITKMELDKT